MGWPLIHPVAFRPGVENMREYPWIGHYWSPRFGARGRSEIPENLKNDDARFDQQNEPPGAHWEHFFGHRGGDPNGGHTTRVKLEELTRI